MIANSLPSLLHRSFRQQNPIKILGQIPSRGIPFAEWQGFGDDQKDGGIPGRIIGLLGSCKIEI